MIEKYIKLYLKRNIWLGSVCATIVAIPMLITSLIYDVLEYDLLISLIPFPIAVIVVLFCSLPIPRFRKMIQEQETLYGTAFNDADVEHLETTLYIAKDWLIWAGVSAFHRKHIKEISHKLRHGRPGTSNEVRIVTVDNKKYTTWCLSASHVKNIKSWLKS